MIVGTGVALLLATNEFQYDIGVKMEKVIKFIGALALTTLSASVFANPIAGTTCGADRIGTASGATHCAYATYAVGTAQEFDVNGTFKAADIATLYGDTWVIADELEGPGAFGVAANGYLYATATNGWGPVPNSGTFGIDESFWDVYDHAVLSIHIGGGQSIADNWAWLMDNGLTDLQTWSITVDPAFVTNGGGLSNIKLWGVRGGNVPEPGMIALLAVGLVSIAVVRRKKTV